MLSSRPKRATCQNLHRTVLLIISLLIEQVTSLAPAQGVSLASWAYDWGLFGGYPQETFRSSELRPPRLNTAHWSEQCSWGYTLLSLRGVAVPRPAAILVDGRGEMVWMDESFGYVMNLKAQKYRGEQYLTFWSGTFGEGFGRGTYYLLDSHYQIYRQFSTAGHGDGSDFHEFTITSNDTALLTIYETRPADLSSFGINGEGWIYDSVFQEADIETGEVLFEWRASEHFAINETFYPLGAAGRSPYHPFDFFHINSIDKDGDGNYVISSRMLHSVICISATTGEVIWVLGGRRNEFADVSHGTATNFRWQHHASVQQDGTISIFDNAKWMKWYTEVWDHGEISRGMLLRLDTINMTAELVQEFTNPTLRGSPQQGSMQILEGSGNAVIGWGYSGAFTEFSPSGDVLCDTHINPSIAFSYGLVHSYRAFRAPHWVGRPNTPPAIYMRKGDDHAFVSWLGSTETYKWVLQTAKDDPTEDLVFTNSTDVVKQGFETLVAVHKGDFKYVRIAAVDQHGRILATTKVIRTDKGTAVSRRRLLAIYSGVLLGSFLLLALVWRRGLRGMVNLVKQGFQSSTSCIARRYYRLRVRETDADIEYKPLHID